MATYEILTQQTLANIINAAVPGTYTPAEPRKCMSYSEVLAVKNNIASTVKLTINRFIKNDGTTTTYKSRQLVQKVTITAQQVDNDYEYTVSSKAYGATVIIATVHPTEDTVVPGTPLGYDDNNDLEEVTFTSNTSGTYLATVKQNSTFKWADMAKSSLSEYKDHYGGFEPDEPQYQDPHTNCISVPGDEAIQLKIVLEHVNTITAPFYYVTHDAGSAVYILHLKVKTATRTPKDTSKNISAGQNISILPNYDDTVGGTVVPTSVVDYTTRYTWPDGTHTDYDEPSIAVEPSIENYHTQDYSNDTRLLPIMSNVPAGKVPVHRLSVFVRNYLYPTPTNRVFVAKGMDKLDVWIKRTVTVTPTTKNVTFTVNCEVDASGNVTPVLQVSFTESVGPASGQFYVTATVNGEFGQFPLTVTPADLSGYLQNGNYYGNFDGSGVVNISQLGNNPTITNAQYYNLDSDWTADIYNGVIRQMTS